MTYRLNYAWQVAYVCAILETDEALRCSHTYLAIAAMEQRRLDPLDRDEELALTLAEAGLEMLISEINAKNVRDPHEFSRFTDDDGDD